MRVAFGHVQPGRIACLRNHFIVGRNSQSLTLAPVWIAANVGQRDARGGIYDLVDMGGQPVSERKRIWPVTEAIKAWATRVRIRQDAASRDALITWIRFIMDRYFTGNGGWHEYLDPALRPDSDYMPASTPYHIAMAALEVERLMGGPGVFGLGADR